MDLNQPSYDNFFQPNDQVTIGIHLSDNSFMEDSATILYIEDDLVLLELYGRGLPDHLEARAGARIIVTSQEGWALYRCEALLDEAVTDREVRLRLTGEMEVKQRREFFRMDVLLPAHYTLPADQQLSTILKEWELRKRQSSSGLAPDAVPCGESFMVRNWEGGRDVEPTRINLSGGGLRLKIRDSLAYGALLHLDIFLPTPQVRVIHAIGSVVRSKELLLSMDRYTYFSTAMTFKFIENRDREAIIGYIFNEQRNRLWQESTRRG